MQIPRPHPPLVGSILTMQRKLQIPLWVSSRESRAGDVAGRHMGLQAGRVGNFQLSAEAMFSGGERQTGPMMMGWEVSGSPR